MAREWTSGVKLVPVGFQRCCPPSGHFCTTLIPSAHATNCRIVFWFLTTFFTFLQTMADVSGVAVMAVVRGRSGEWIWEKKALVIVCMRERVLALRSWFHWKSDCWYMCGKTSTACRIRAQMHFFFVPKCILYQKCITNVVPISSQTPLKQTVSCLPYKYRGRQGLLVWPWVPFQ